MKILKKILAIAIILGIFGQVAVNSTFAYDYKNEYREKILTYKDGEEYIIKIDKFVEKISEEKAKKIKKKIVIILSSDRKISEKTIVILKYLVEKIDEKEFLLAEQAKKEIFNNKLSESDTKKVNEQLVKIQKNILEQGVSSFEKILGELETYTNYQEEGNFELRLNLDNDNIGNSKSSLILKDYILKKSGFDSKFQTKIEAIVEAAPKGQDEIKMQINAFIDYIIKDQNYYILLKDFDLIDEKGIEKINSYIEKIKEISKKNKYIKIEDKNAAQIISQLKQFNPENILKQGNSIVAKPLFKAYKKVGNKYYLVPSKYGCDTAKTLSQKFDPFNGNTCTESQYQDLLSDIADSKTEFYIDFSGKNTKIGFESKQNGMDKLEGDIVFSEKYIEEINFIATPDQQKYPGEGASLNFVRAKKLNARFYAKSGKVNFNLNSELDYSNKFKFINLNYKNSDNFSGELILKNRKISGKYSGKGYSSKYVGIISGKTDYNNKLANFKISNQYINSSSWNPGETNTIFEYNYGKYSIDNKYVSKGLKSDFVFSVDVENSRIVAGNLLLDIEKKNFSYDDNYKKVYTGDFEKIVDSKIEFKNKYIQGKTIIFDKNKEYLEITNTGKYIEDEFELNTKIELLNEVFNPLTSYFGYTSSIRDTNRIAQLKSMSDALELYRTKKDLPLPDDYIEVKENGEVIAYKGKIGKNVLETIGYTESGLDPKFKTYFDFYVTKNRKYFNIKTCLEKEDYNGNKIHISGKKEIYDYVTGKNTIINYGDTSIECSKFVADDKKEKKVEANLNIKTDTTSNKNNFNIYGDVKLDDKKIIEIELDNKSRKIYKDVEILAPLPDDTIPLDEAFENPELY